MRNMHMSVRAWLAVAPRFCSSDTFDLIASFMESAHSSVDGARPNGSLSSHWAETVDRSAQTPPGRFGFLDRAPDKVLDQLRVPKGPSVGARVRGVLIEGNWSSLLANYSAAEASLEGQRAELMATPYRPILDLPPLGAIASALAGYESTCEHPGWPGSAAFHICARVKGLIVRRIPGYGNGPWTDYQRLESETRELRLPVSCSA